MTFSRHQLAQRTTLDAVDLEEVHRCRRAHNQLGFAYQVGFVRLLNRFPKQEPFEVLDELLLFTGVQLGVATNLIDEYRRRRQTISEHQQRITRYRGLRHFAAEERQLLVAFVFDAASRLEQTSSLHKRAEEFLAEQLILRPSEATIARLVGEQRQRARDRIVDRVVRTCLVLWRAGSTRSSSWGTARPCRRSKRSSPTPATRRWNRCGSPSGSSG